MRDLKIEDFLFDIRFELNASDTFAYACADSVIVEGLEAYELLNECFDLFGTDGYTAFLSTVRGEDVIEPWKNQKFHEAMEWLKDRDIPKELPDWGRDDRDD